jgi:hypothetical protein
MPRSLVSPEIKAAALADLAAGEQPAIVAKRYGLSRDMVNKWRQRAIPLIVSAPMSTDMSAVVSTQRVVRYPTIEEYQARIHQRMLALLEAKINASERLAEHIQADWLDKQSAGGLAELGDFLDRTAVGLLAVLARSGERDD